MKNYDHLLFPIFLIGMGCIILSGVNLFGSAILEGAAWKQNVIFTLMLIFGMLPPGVREMKPTWMGIGFALAFFMFGGANFIGTVGIMLGLEKIMLGVLMLFMGYRLWAETWKINKFYMVAPVCGLIFAALLFPIEDQSIIGSTINVISNWSTSAFTSDKGFHIYLGLLGIAAGVTEMLIQTKAPVVIETDVIDISE